MIVVKYWERLLKIVECPPLDGDTIAFLYGDTIAFLDGETNKVL